uniref:non-specific serine/threonine protein kinase n=1 Tax=Pohlia nutans TaxID=140635 RepID=A0A1P8DYW1_9BRYO|nr:leucine-rich repeat receptor-like protein kinase [Pohlia nutans]
MKGLSLRNSWLLLLASLMLLFASGSAVSDPTETAALLAVKKSIGDKQGKLADWQGTDPCGPPSWTGIFCIQNLTAYGNVSVVREIHLLGFGLTGTISPQFGNLTHLSTLDLMHNQLTGNIPPELGNLEQLYLLLLNGNKLTGSIPSQLGNLMTMNRLQLDENSLTGEIPSSLGNLTNLRHMHLNNNSLSGQIPSEIGRNDSILMHVLVDNNNLTGPLPTSFESLSYLLIIQVDNNPIGGTIPNEWGQIPSLIKLSARNCSLEGPVPSLAALTSLHYLDLSKNKLEGYFPTNFSLDLITIDVSENNFIGAIPDAVASLQDIQALEFAFNGFNGSIPENLGSAASFKNQTQQTIVDLRNNTLTGYNILITDAGEENGNVTLRLSGNPICTENFIPDRLQLKYCIDHGNETVDDSSGSVGNACASCKAPSMAVLDSPQGQCRCATPIELEIRLKSPSFSFFNRFQNEFYSLVTSVLHLNDSQVHLGKLEWQPGPRLYMLMYLFPAVNATFDSSEYNRLFQIVANWQLSAGTEWALSVIGPYELLSFSEVAKAPSKSFSKAAIAGIAVGCAVLAAALSTFVFFWCNRKKWKAVPQKSFAERSLALMPPGLKLAGVKAFTFEEVQRATNNFHIDSTLGRGGYGHVYKGLLPDGMLVAVKRADGGSLQGSEQFYTEIELLSRVHHRNLVQLIGFCNDQGEQMLVYEFMPGGNLRDHLIPTEMLDYATRVRIALGTAKGILYLHNEADPPIFHRDIKASNILLDQKLNAKVADFGLSKLAPTPEMSGSTPEGVSTNVRGTPGYLDPEYFMTNKLTDKSDVYSFGVVLLELITGMLPIAHGKNIVREIQDGVRDGKFWDQVDPCMGSYPRKGVEALLELALACVETDQDKRPQMIEVTRDLETILRDTVAPESPSSFWNRGDSSNGSSFNKSELWSGKKLISPSSLGLINPNDVSWASSDELMNNHSRDVTIEMEPR